MCKCPASDKRWPPKMLSRLQAFVKSSIRLFQRLVQSCSLLKKGSKTGQSGEATDNAWMNRPISCFITVQVF